MNAVAYCRVSTDEQDQLNSLETQKEFFESYAKKAGYDLIHIYSDPGISGTKTKNRAQFNQMMKDAQSGVFSIILVKDISRLARNTVDLLEACRRLREYGVEIQFINYKMTNMGSSEFLITIFAAIAQEESYNTSQRIKFSKKFHAEQGKVPNLIFGYDKIENDYFNLSINECEAAVIKEIFRRYVENGDGTTKIAKSLNAQGVKTKRGCDWTQAAVARIISNPIYTGKVINGKEEIVNFPDSKRVSRAPSDWITVENEKLRIIDDEVFERAQKLLSERSSSFGNKQHSNTHLFSTLIKCKECGRSFRRTSRTYKNTFVKWVCSERNLHGKDACPNATSVDEEELISALREYFVKIIKNKENYIQFSLKKIKDSQQESSQSEEMIAEIGQKLAEMKKQKEKILKLYLNGFLTMEDLSQKLEHTKEEIPRLEKELAKLRSQKPSIAPNEEALKEILSHIEKITDIRSLSNATLKKIIKQIVADKDGHIDIYLNMIGE